MVLGRHFRSSLSIVLVVVLGLTASITASILVGVSVRHSDQLLLRQDAAQASLLIGPLLGDTMPDSNAMAAAVSPAGVDTTAWDQAANAASKSIGSSSIALVHLDGAHLDVAASIGTIHVSFGSADDLALAQAARTGHLPYIVSVVGGNKHFAGELYRATDLPAGYLLYGEFPAITAPFSLNSLPGKPFSHIVAAIYMGRVAPSNLLLTTTSHMPLLGEVAVTRVELGSQFAVAPVKLTSSTAGLDQPGSLLLVMKADGQLSGSWAGSLPWVLLIGGFLVVAVVGSVFALSERRRTTAVRAVGELKTRNSELDQAIAMRQRSDARFAAMVRASSDLTTVVTPEGEILYQSPSALQLLGVESESLVGQSFTALIHHDDIRVWQRMITLVTQNPAAEGTASWRLLTATGDYVTVETHVTNLMDNAAVAGIVLNSRDVSDRMRLEDELRHQAFHDSLTGLANRALFQDRLEHAIARLHRTSGSLSVLFLDLDDFKAVNDARGHGVGDDLLRAVSGRLRNTIRSGDTLARLGGDEFAVLLEACDETGAVTRSERILEALSRAFAIAGGEVSMRASIGVVVTNDGSTTVEDLLRNADIAMYAAKSAGKSRFELFHSGLHEQVITRLQLESDLSKAVTNEELFVEYQPIIDLTTGKVSGLEALMRWNHPRRGLVMPVDFIPVAESTGLIIPMGRWLLHRACLDIRTLQEQCERFDLHLAVNLSARQLDDPSLVNDVESALHLSGLHPEQLTLEITETVFMSNPEESLDLIERLKALGVKLSIDDFGTGYSSLAYLQRIPVDELKIDRSFVADTDKPESSALVQTIVRLARDFGLETVAEGIETEAQLERLRAAGCHSAQGFLFARPVGVEHLHQAVTEAGRHPSLLAGATAGAGLAGTNGSNGAQPGSASWPAGVSPQ